MSEQLEQIAERARGLREIAGLSQESAALEFGLPLETYAAYESGKEDIPVGVLYEMANRFGVELTDLLTGESPRLHTYCLVRKGKGVAIDRSHEYDYQSLAQNFIHKKAEPFLVTVAPGRDGKVHLNQHPGQEFNYVLEGELAITIDGHELILEPGDSLFFDSNLKHGMRAAGAVPVRLLVVIC